MLLHLGVVSVASVGQACAGERAQVSLSRQSLGGGGCVNRGDVDERILHEMGGRRGD